MRESRPRLGLAAGVLAVLIPKRPATRPRLSLQPARRIIHLGRASAQLATLGALLAALPATSPAQSAMVARILTDWGTFRCAAIRCSPARGALSLYWSAPVLYVTKDHVPLLRRRCVLVSARSTVWDCRHETVAQLPGSWSDVHPDSLWDWLPVFAEAPDDD